MIDTATLIYCANCRAVVPVCERPLRWVAPASLMTISGYECPHCRKIIGFSFNATP